MCNRNEVHKKYYEDKMIEKYKYDKLLEERYCTLFYCRSQGNYLYWLNDLPNLNL